jgi:tRNA G26 N,N-dimethylase Trm1
MHAFPAHWSATTPPGKRTLQHIKTKEVTVSVTVVEVREIAREVDNLLNTIRGTVELLAESGFQEDIYHPSLRAVETIASRAHKQPCIGSHNAGL